LNGSAADISTRWTTKLPGARRFVPIPKIVLQASQKTLARVHS
jgi:hypothetical protein